MAGSEAEQLASTCSLCEQCTTGPLAQDDPGLCQALLNVAATFGAGGEEGEEGEALALPDSGSGAVVDPPSDCDACVPPAWPPEDATPLGMIMVTSHAEGLEPSSNLPRSFLESSCRGPLGTFVEPSWKLL